MVCRAPHHAVGCAIHIGTQSEGRRFDDHLELSGPWQAASPGIVYVPRDRPSGAS